MKEGQGENLGVLLITDTKKILKREYLKQTSSYQGSYKIKVYKRISSQNCISYFYFHQSLFWSSALLPITSKRSGVCKIGCKFMVLVFLIILYFSVSSLSTFGFTFPYFHFENTAYFLLLAALSLIIFLSDFLSYSHLNHEINDSHFSSIHSHLTKCVYIFFS